MAHHSVERAVLGNVFATKRTHRSVLRNMMVVTFEAAVSGSRLGVTADINLLGERREITQIMRPSDDVTLRAVDPSGRIQAMTMFTVAQNRLR